LAEAKRLIQESQDQTAQLLADQADELILHKADILTDSYIAELPDEYNDEDLNIIRTVLVDHINWDSIEENPDVLPEAFAEGFQSALTWYGTPKGSAPAPAKAGESDETATETESMTEEKLAKFVDQDWGKLKEVETPDGKVLVPEVSDEDWPTVLADVMKAANKLSG